MPTTTPPAPHPKIEVIRTQYRVGHGGFHTTIVKQGDASFVYAYDTGATPEVARVRSAIDDFVSTLRRLDIACVDYLILSHIDEDHVNAFNDLVTALDAAKIDHPTVLLPWLEPTEKLFALAHANHRDPDAVAVSLAADDEDVVAYFTESGFDDVVFVLPTDPASNIDPPSGARLISNGTNLAASSAVPWVLIATRIKPEQRVLDAFRDRIRKHTKRHASRELDPHVPSDRLTLVKSHRSLIRSAMKTVATKFSVAYHGHSLTNWSSLSIFGASPSPTLVHMAPSVTSTSDLVLPCDHGWLHTGDLPLDVPDVWTSFENEWNRVLPSIDMCALAAPHHGSPNGHNIALFAKFAPASVLYMTGWTKGSVPGMPLYAKKINATASKADAIASGAAVIELNNP